MTFDEAQMMASVRERALTLFESGYRARWRGAHVLEVASPQGARYRVDTRLGSCECAFFQRHEGRYPCKHLLGWGGLLACQRAARRRLMLMALLSLREWAELDDGAPAAWRQESPAEESPEDKEAVETERIETEQMEQMEGENHYGGRAAG